MKKKILAILTALVLVLSVAPLSIFADSTVCGNCGGEEWTGYIQQGFVDGKGVHAIECKNCGELQHEPAACTSFTDKCWLCSGLLVEPVCDHEGGAWMPNGDGTHTSTCDCGKVFTSGPCQSLEIGGTTCYMCGGEIIPAVPEEPACKHEWKGVANKDEATHNIVCRDCEEVLDVESHKFVDGICACGAIYVEEEPVCEHEWKGVVNNDEATHKVVCRDCEEVLDVESHKFVDGICACGAIYTHEHDYEAGVTSNEDGTHNINCSCGEFVNVKCLDNDGDGKCDSCGYQKYVAPEEEPEVPDEEPSVPSTPVEPSKPNFNPGKIWKDKLESLKNWISGWFDKDESEEPEVPVEPEKPEVPDEPEVPEEKPSVPVAPVVPSKPVQIWKNVFESLNNWVSGWFHK